MVYQLQTLPKVFGLVIFRLLQNKGACWLCRLRLSQLQQILQLLKEDWVHSTAHFKIDQSLLPTHGRQTYRIQLA